MCSSSVQDMDVCPRISLLCSPVVVEALRRADPCPWSPTRCRTDLDYISEVILSWNRSQGLIFIADDEKLVGWLVGWLDGW
jgi:hypothetical protein